ncbi:hypothetical protein SPRG_07647 [Saprolegnia parasitica CBS 223.65]|uniref:Uncharacterized protein n=1 Tax=Saprolegnia parasitica (strain CBS 223.65) TaxID=695850 RepID=A0A067C8T8_SAPPC|nr:hypothetical protein SPRG_07647 [Saprolegnia parasitica CBS 223.65]KDO26933.1 hypothetical protein SPRG_07647 [Saprolegnia parasitica CBS 223.65]|eukprot:XP_012202315.1 hypothetical protein SPRG_07647 [Saprolegnia parasitica CBS 223.65]
MTRSSVPPSMAHMKPCVVTRPRPSEAPSQETTLPAEDEETHSLVLETEEVHSDDGLDADLNDYGDDGLDEEDFNFEYEAEPLFHADQHDAQASTQHAVNERSRLKAFATDLYPCVRALCRFQNPVLSDRPCDVDGCGAGATSICKTCHDMHTVAHMCQHHADVHFKQAIGHKMICSTEQVAKDIKCCPDGIVTEARIVRLHTFDIDADRVFLKTCADHRVGPLLVGMGFMPDNMDHPSTLFRII